MLGLLRTSSDRRKLEIWLSAGGHIMRRSPLDPEERQHALIWLGTLIAHAAVGTSAHTSRKHALLDNRLAPGLLERPRTAPYLGLGPPGALCTLMAQSSKPVKFTSAGCCALAPISRWGRHGEALRLAERHAIAVPPELAQIQPLPARHQPLCPRIHLGPVGTPEARALMNAICTDQREVASSPQVAHRITA